MRRLVWISVAWLAFTTPVVSDVAGHAGAPCARVVAVGDLHGSHRDLVDILVATDLIDRDGTWVGGGACFVQLGDIVDRGPDARAILDLLMRLEREAPGRVTVLLGNHEVMTLTDDLRMVTDEGFDAFAGEEDAAERERGFRSWASRFEPGTPEDALRELFDREYPAGWFARRRAFAPDGRYGAWLLERDAVRRIGRSVFVHGGLSPADATLGIEAVNATVRSDVRDYLSARETLFAAGVLDPLGDFARHVGTIERLRQAIAAAEEAEAEGSSPESAPGIAPPGSDLAPGVVAALDRAWAAIVGTLIRQDGPLWNRDLAEGDEHESIGEVERILDLLDADRIVVGHTPTDSRHVEERFWGRVVRIDSGASPYYRGQASALEIENGTTTAVYLGRRERLEGLVPSLTDAELEAWLREGAVVHREPIGTGITEPERLTLERDGATRRAAFKSVDIDARQGRVIAGGEVDLRFSDSHRYDVAAYRLDRMLGIGLVPVAVLRTIDGREGVVVDWIEGAVMENVRRERGLSPPPPAAVARRQAIVRLFDAWIANTDRNLTNQLFVPASGKFYLIDHTRAFRPSATLPKEYRLAPARVPEEIYERLRDLDPDAVRAALDDVLSHGQIRALIRRGERIVDKIEDDVRTHGGDAVFGRL